MNLITNKKFPFAFNVNACSECKGKCCNGESGNIWVNKKEIEAIASYLEITPDEFIDKYLRKKQYRYTIKELKTGNNYACLFFDVRINGCSIYEVRPKQCKTFPFWDYYETEPNQIYNDCPGCIPL